MDPGNVDVERLLAEAPWLRRLARGLVRGEAAAEDLSQEVLAAALSERPDLQGLSGVGLRSWLRTVARRLAGRSRERDAARREVEARVARPDPDEAARGADERLELHRRLSAALDRLPPLYRTALVLRYLEELPPREIAARLAIPPTAARKRVSRGLALLREELDRDFEGRAGWLAALGPLAAPSVAEPLLRGPDLDRSLSDADVHVHPVFRFQEVAVMGLSLPKLAAVSACAAAAILLLARGSQRADGPALQPLAGPTASVASPADELATEVSVPGEQSARRVVPAEGPLPESPLPAVPRLRVVDEAGAPITDAVAAWVDAQDQVHPLELDEDGTAALPGETTGAVFLARAPGHGPAFAHAVGTEDLTLALPETHVVRGLLTEEGEPPQHALELWVFVGIPPGLELQRPALEALQQTGLLDSYSYRAVSQTGAWELPDVPPGQVVRLRMPQTHRLKTVDGEPWLDREGCELAPGATTVQLDTVRLPEILARIVWDDEGSPPTPCSATARVTGTSSQMDVGVHVDTAGRLRYGVPVAERSLQKGREERQRDLEASRIELMIHARGAEPHASWS